MVSRRRRLSLEARSAPAASVGAMACTASPAVVSRLRLLKKEIVNSTRSTKHRAAAEANRMRRDLLVLVLDPLAPMAARSASRMSLNRWLRKSHCGTLRVVATGGDAALGAAPAPPGRKMPVAPATEPYPAWACGCAAATG